MKIRRFLAKEQLSINHVFFSTMICSALADSYYIAALFICGFGVFYCGWMDRLMTEEA